ncbi:hypothetical protein [Olsenella sp. CU969]|uniref:hypothetical protein n=1 Tax=Olsenella sp. CU969 TaxID=2780101 RepID=UPI00195C0175|nr:hypothetical protein [Olsenella sp. CU969]
MTTSASTCPAAAVPSDPRRPVAEASAAAPAEKAAAAQGPGEARAAGTEATAWATVAGSADQSAP